MVHAGCELRAGFALPFIGLRVCRALLRIFVRLVRRRLPLLMTMITANEVQEV